MDAVVGYSHAQLIVRDAPCIVLFQDHARRTARPHPRIEHLVEPSDIAPIRKHHPPFSGHERPRLSPLEKRPRPGAEFRQPPALRYIRPNKHSIRGKVFKISTIARSRQRMPTVEHFDNRCRIRGRIEIRAFALNRLRLRTLTPQHQHQRCPKKSFHLPHDSSII